MEQHRLLMRAFQNDCTVHEYDALLQQFFNTIGINGEHEMVNCLWMGLQNEIQVRLWHEILHPEYSSYPEVLEVVKLIEIIEDVSKSKVGSKHQKNSDRQPVSGGNNAKGNNTLSRQDSALKLNKNHRHFDRLRNASSNT